MKVSLEWVRDWVDLPASVTAAELASELTLKTVEVEAATVVGSDVILDIDNKSLTNRPDLWGHYGIAREVAAIFGLPLRPLPAVTRPEAVTGLVGDVDPELCGRFAAVEFTSDGAAAAPAWLRDRLARIGEMPRHPLVDLSNYVMYAVGQPTHLYDADRLLPPLSPTTATPAATATTATTAGEQLELLTGQTVELTEQTPVIKDAREIVGLAGVMGSAGSAVTAQSRRFVLEAATFQARLIRRASQQLGLRTEASARFEKGIDTQRVDAALTLFLQLLPKVAPLARVTGMQDVTAAPTPAAEILITREFLDRRIGQRLDMTEIESTLRALGFAVQALAAEKAEKLRVTAPSWRSTGDVSLPEDLVEEVARIHGYDRLAVARTSVTLRPVRMLNRMPLDRQVREQLATRAGLQEVITYPWTSDQLLAAAGLAKDETVRLQGAPAPDRDSLRPSLVPNLLDAVAANLRYCASFGIFEVGTVFGGPDLIPYRGVFEPLPRQTLALAIALAGAAGTELFREAKGMLSMLSRRCFRTDLALKGDASQRWADKSARLGIWAGDQRVGVLALVTPRARRLAGIAGAQVACVELDLGPLTTFPSRQNRFEPLPDLPASEFDVSVVVADDITWAAVERTVGSADPLITAVAYIGEYRGDWVPAGSRSLTLRVTLQPREATLTAGLIATVREAVLAVLDRDLNAKLR